MGNGHLPSPWRTSVLERDQTEEAASRIEADLLLSPGVLGETFLPLLPSLLWAVILTQCNSPTPRCPSPIKALVTSSHNDLMFVQILCGTLSFRITRFILVIPNKSTLFGYHLNDGIWGPVSMLNVCGLVFTSQTSIFQSNMWWSRPLTRKTVISRGLEPDWGWELLNWPTILLMGNSRCEPGCL